VQADRNGVQMGRIFQVRRSLGEVIPGNSPGADGVGSWNPGFTEISFPGKRLLRRSREERCLDKARNIKDKIPWVAGCTTEFFCYKLQ